MNEWIEELSDLAAAGEAAVLVTISGIRGSTPRETGAKMIVTARETIGTIGGGQLEYQCTARAVEMIGSKSTGGESRRFSLGSNCGQCCGGVVEIRFDPVPAAGIGWLTDLVDAWRDRHTAILATKIDESHTKFVIADTDGLRMLPPNPAREAKALFAEGGAVVVDGWLLEPVDSHAMDIAVFGAGYWLIFG